MYIAIALGDRRWSGGASYSEMRLETALCGLVGDRRSATGGEQREQQVDGLAAAGNGRHRDRSEGWGTHGCHRDVVKADHADLARNGDSAIVEPADYTQGHQVVECDNARDSRREGDVRTLHPPPESP